MEIMKPADLYLKNDLSYGSVSHLIEKIQSRTNLPSPWFVDHPFATPEKTEVTNTVFFGNYLKRFLESGLWTSTQHRFWVLSEPIKNVFTHAFGFQPSQIGVINRYDLFPIAAPPRPLPQIHEAQDWIYAGRLSESKKILTLIYLVHELQTRYHSPFQLHIFGDFISDEVQFLSPTQQEAFKSQVFEIVESLKWPVKPVFHGFVEENNWLERTYRNPVYVSLSQFPYEDFAVSVALAQQKGWPVLLSSWGGHLDVAGAHFIPAHLLNPRFEPAGLEKLRAEAIARFLVEERTSAKTANLSDQVQDPVPVSLQEIDEKRRTFLERFGSEMKFVLKDLKPLAWYEAQGAAYFDLEEQCLSNDFEKRSEFAIVADKRGDFSLSDSAHAEIVQLLLQGARAKTYFVQNLASKTQFMQLLKAPKIFRGCHLSDNSPALKLLKTIN